MLIHKLDNVEVNLENGHKYAIRPIKKGENVIKYGNPIGHATEDIAVGDHVHTHNVATNLSDNLTYTYDPGDLTFPIADQGRTFRGYLRANGDVGIRNEIWIIPTVGCVNSIVREIETLSKKYKTDNIDGIYSYNHPYGCSQLGDDMKIFAEDLGIITPEVEALRDECGFPGMKVLQFGFEAWPTDPFYPHNFKTTNCICYTGTHDNNTTFGWYADAKEEARDRVRRYLNCDGGNVSWDFIRLAMSSIAKYAIYPMQDVLRLGSEARMNVPGLLGANWAWRFEEKDVQDWHAVELKKMTNLFNR